MIVAQRALTSVTEKQATTSRGRAFIFSFKPNRVVRSPDLRGFFAQQKSDLVRTADTTQDPQDHEVRRDRAGLSDHIR